MTTTRTPGRTRRRGAAVPVALLLVPPLGACSEDAPSARDALATVCGDAEVEDLDAAPYDDFDGEAASEDRGDLVVCAVSFDLPTNYYAASYASDPTEDLEGITESASQSDGDSVAWTLAGSGEDWTVVWVIGPGDADVDRLRLLDDDGFEIQSDETTY